MLAFGTFLQCNHGRMIDPLSRTQVNKTNRLLGELGLWPTFGRVLLGIAVENRLIVDSVPGASSRFAFFVRNNYTYNKINYVSETSAKLKGFFFF